jgi:type VI secretion system secreted protein VgrG
MSTYTQAGRFLTLTCPLGPDKLLLVGVSGTESMSQLFRFQFEMIAENATDIPFDQILGKKITAHIEAPGDNTRHISGICSRLSQGGRDAYFTTYRAEVVPEFWFLTRKAQSRIFQAKSVPDILKIVLQGLSVTYNLKGQYDPRDYCVQYRETDFNFASRLMEEEGIFYFFKHTDSSHTMVVADTPDANPDVPFDSKATFEPLSDDMVDQDRIFQWEKAQDLRSTKFTLWDHCFEKPHDHLQADQPLTPSATLGTVSHKLALGDTSRLEIYDWPGEYAQRFDGVGPGREDRPEDIQKIFQDNKRTVDIRMQQEAATALTAAGASRLRQLTAGHKFTLDKHFNADGAYVVTSVHHVARMSGNYRTGDMDEIAYDNTFTCLPTSVPFRPQRVTPKPVIQGTQTAVVVGPAGEEVYTDKYGRVKVQFHWDRQGKNDEKSSCWIRCSQPVAGRRWGFYAWPRIGQEVVVDHLEGDPDQPIIVGTVFNADQMPPYLGKGPDGEHPEENLLTGFKSNSSKGGSGYNEMRFFDSQGKEQIFFHAQRNMDTRVLKDSMETVVGDRHLMVGGEGGNQYEQVAKNKHLHVQQNHVEKIDQTMQLAVLSSQDIQITGQKTETLKSGSDLHVSGVRRTQVDGNDNRTIGGNHAEKIGGSQDVTIGSNRNESIGGALNLSVGGNRNESVGASQSLNVAQNQQESIGQNLSVSAGQQVYLSGGMNVVIEAGMSLTLLGPGGFITINEAGIAIQGMMVLINSGGAPGSGSPPSPTPPQSPQSPAAPTDAQQAAPTTPTKADDSITGTKSD